MLNLAHRPLGHTGVQIPPIVFGTTCLGNLFVAMSPSDKAELVRRWFECVPGPVAIDSAGKYGAGLALEVLGRELQSLGIEPSDVVISNKLAWRRVPLQGDEPTFEPGVWKQIDHDAVQDISAEGILRCHEDGCRMLGQYSPQLVSVHDPDEYLAAARDPQDRERRLQDIRGALGSLANLRDAGKVAGIGVGAKDWTVIRELDAVCALDWVMVANSFTIMNHPPELIEFLDSLQQRGIAVINSAVTHGGFLVGGEYLNYRSPDPNDADDAKALAWREAFQKICERHSVSPFEVAVAFGRSHPAIDSVALSTSRPQRVEGLVRTVIDQPPTAVWDELREADLIAADYPHVSG